MGAGGSRVRLRQAVLVAAELEPVASTLRSALNLNEPFRDPGVGEFGLANVVFALGDCFVEVVSPIQRDTAAGRYLARHGDGGYMVIFDLEDLQGARGRALGLGVRVIWQIDLPDISGTHLHPADMRGAIVSLDRSEPYGTWRWGGPQWTGRIGAGAPGTPGWRHARGERSGGRGGALGEVLGVPRERQGRIGSRGRRGCCAWTAARSALRRPPASGPKGWSRLRSSSRTSCPVDEEAIELGGVRVRRVGPGSAHR